MHVSQAWWEISLAVMSLDCVETCDRPITYLEDSKLLQGLVNACVALISGPFLQKLSSGATWQEK